MPKTDFTEFVTLARQLISDNGRTVTFEQFAQTAADPAKPWAGPTDPRVSVAATVDVDAVFVPPSSFTELGRSTGDSSLVARAEQIMIVETPTTGEDLSTMTEVVDTDGTRWKIENVETLKPADVVILYFVAVRR